MAARRVTVARVRRTERFAGADGATPATELIACSSMIRHIYTGALSMRQFCLVCTARNERRSNGMAQVAGNSSYEAPTSRRGMLGCQEGGY